MATALLISGQVKAATVNVTANSEQTLRDAFTNANPGDVVNITMTKDLELTGEATGQQGLVLGEAGGLSTADGITVNLNLGGFELTKNSTKEFPVIRVNKGTLNVSNGTISTPSYNSQAPAIFIFGSLDSLQSNYTVVKIAKGASITSNAYCVVVNEIKNTATEHFAYGVVLNVDGYLYGGKYGIKVNGPIRGGGDNLAQINVSSSAEIECAPSPETVVGNKTPIGVYCSGQAVYNISGYVHGSIGVVVKAGTVVIEDAIIASTATTYDSIAFDHKGSGIDGGNGCGLVVYTDRTGYAAGQEVIIKGDTKISGSEGYAVIEAVLTGQEGKVTSITMEGGTIEGGTQGGMSFTVDNSPKVVIGAGSNVSGDVEVGDQKTQLAVLTDTTSTHITTVKIGGKDVLIVSDGKDAPAECADINTAEANTSVTLAAGTMTLNADKQLDVIEMTKATALTIPAGKTLKANKILMGQNASITIAVGAKLLVMGEEGVYAPVVTNLVIKADENGRGVFAFNPNCVSNRSPMATMEYYTTAGKVGTNEAFWDLVASPFAVLDTVYLAEGGGIAFQGHTSTGWVDYQSRQEFIDDNEAFKMFATRPAVAARTGSVYVFKGQLQGNISGVFKLNKGFNYIGNGYAAGMQAQKMISIIKSRGANVRTLLYTWDPREGYTLYNENFDVPGDLSSMKAFVLYANSETTIDLDYNELIWKQFVNE